MDFSIRPKWFLPILTIEIFLRTSRGENKNFCEISKEKDVYNEGKCLWVANECSFDTHKSGDFLNVAFNKPARMSTRYRYYGRTNPAGGAVNGRIGTFYETRPPNKNCVHTASFDRNIYWEVDLTRVYTFQDIIIYGRVFRGNAQTRFRGSHLFVDGQLCYSFPPYLNNGNPVLFYTDYNKEKKRFEIACGGVLTGRYVRLQKIYKHLYKYFFDAFIVMCEVQIFVCKPGYYGIRSCQRCPQKCPYGCDNYRGCGSAPVLVNLAIKGKTEASTEDTFHEAYRPVDGSALRDNFCFQTNAFNRGDRYWQVFLGQYSRVNKIIIIYPQGIEYRTGRFELSVAQGSRGVQKQLCATHSGRFQTSFIYRCNPELKGFYVYISAKITELHQLRFCEVLVFGVRLKELFKGESGFNPASTECKLVACSPETTCEENKCRVGIGSRCESQDHCPLSSICEFGECRLKPYQECGQFRSLCRSGTKCTKGSRSDYKCRKPLGGSCTKTDDCSEDSGQSVVCDFTKICRVGLNANCKKQEDCPAGGKCEDQACICDQAKSSGSTSNGKQICIPKDVGTKCSSDSSCNCDGCICKDQKCQCGQDKILSTDFTCLIAAGSSCGGSKTCSSGLVCEEDQCRVPPGGSCFGENENFCQKDAKCDAGYVCKVKKGKSCETENQCDTESVCEEHICKVRSGFECDTNTKKCASDSTCVAIGNKSECRLRINQKCEKDVPGKKCGLQAVCDVDKICKVDVKGTCSARELPCRKQTVCDTTVKQCRLTLGLKCASPDDCQHGYVCDHRDKTCRIAPKKECSDSSSCLLGSTCTGGKCECIPDVANDDDICSPKNGFVGTACVLADGCVKDEIAICKAPSNATKDETGGKCECPEFYTPDYDLICRSSIGSRCNTTEVDCVRGSKCINNRCLVNVGKPCQKSSECITAAKCDSSFICKVDHGGPCNKESPCANGTECDFVGKCSFGVDAKCFLSESCVAGADCSSDSKCVCNTTRSKASGKICTPLEGKAGGDCSSVKCLDPNAECKSQKCSCKEGFKPDEMDFTCKLDINVKCGQGAECRTGTACDSEENICLLEPGKVCDLEKKLLCLADSECIDGICKRGLKGDCSGDFESHCSSDTVCDNAHKCKLGIGQFCNTTEDDLTFRDCVAGALCKGEACSCNEEVSDESGVLCLPKEGRPGGNCKGGSICIEDAVCNDGICECGTDFDFQYFDFSCSVKKSVRSQQEQQKALLYALVSLGIFAGLCLIVAVAVYFRRRRSRRQDKYKNIMDSRKSNMDTLAKDVSEVTTSAAPGGHTSTAGASSVVGSEAPTTSIAGPSEASLASTDASSAVQETSSAAPPETTSVVSDAISQDASSAAPSQA